VKSIVLISVLALALNANAQCPTPTITLQGAPPPLVCTNTGGTYTYATESGKTQYTWYFDQATGASVVSGQGTNQVTVKYSNATTGSLKVDYFQSGCSYLTGSTTLNVLAAPVATITGPATACTLTNFTLSTASGKSNYSWSQVSPNGSEFPIPASLIISGQGTDLITLRWNIQATVKFAVRYLDASQNGCYTYGTINTQLFNAAFTTIGGNLAPCLSGNTFQYFTQTGYPTYEWTVPVGEEIIFGQNTSGLQVRWHSIGPKTLTVKYGCMTTPYSVTVNVSDVPPVYTITGPTTLPCPGVSASYSVPSGMSTYNWTVAGDGQIQSGGGTNSISVKWASGPGGIIILNYANAAGCITSIPPYTALVDGPKIAPGSNIGCINSTGNVYATDSGMSNYTWNVTSGGAITSGQGTNSIQVSWTSLGAKTVSVSYTGSVNGCTTTTPITRTVNVRSLPVATISGPATACQNVQVGSFQTQQSQSATYQWIVSSGTVNWITSPGLGYNAFATFSSAGNQTISVQYTDIFGCTSLPVSKAVAVTPVATPGITGSVAPCLQSQATYSSGAGKAGYNWTITNGAVISGANTNTIQVGWLSAGAGKVELTTNEGGGCTSPIASLNVNVINGTGTAPTINIPGMEYAGGVGQWCADYQFDLYVTPTNALSYTYYTNGVPETPTASSMAMIRDHSPGNFTHGVMVQYANGCSSYAEKAINNIAGATGIVTGPDNTFVNFNTTFDLTTTPTQNVSNYHWTLINGIVSSTTTTAGVSFPIPGDQTIAATWDYLGCKCQPDPLYPPLTFPAFKSFTVWDYTISPNPANNTVTITLPQSIHPVLNYELRNSLSLIMTSGQITSGNASVNINTTSLANGQYYVTCYFEAGSGKPFLTKALQVNH
jgi:hypothetical protein